MSSFNHNDPATWPPLLTLEEAAPVLRYNDPRSVWELTERGDLPYFRRGFGKRQTRLIRKHQLLAYIGWGLNDVAESKNPETPAPRRRARKLDTPQGLSFRKMFGPKAA